MDKNRLVGAIGFIKAIKPQLSENEKKELKEVCEIRRLADFAEEMIKFEDKVLDRLFREVDRELQEG